MGAICRLSLIKGIWSSSKDYCRIVRSVKLREIWLTTGADRSSWPHNWMDKTFAAPSNATVVLSDHLLGWPSAMAHEEMG